MDELKRCPCGGFPQLARDYGIGVAMVNIGCPSCESMVRIVSHEPDVSGLAAKAIQEWNEMVELAEDMDKEITDGK